MRYPITLSPALKSDQHIWLAQHTGFPHCEAVGNTAENALKAISLLEIKAIEQIDIEDIPDAPTLVLDNIPAELSLQDFLDGSAPLPDEYTAYIALSSSTAFKKTAFSMAVYRPDKCVYEYTGVHASKNINPLMPQLLRMIMQHIEDDANLHIITSPISNTAMALLHDDADKNNLDKPALWEELAEHHARIRYISGHGGDIRFEECSTKAYQALCDAIADAQQKG